MQEGLAALIVISKTLQNLGVPHGDGGSFTRGDQDDRGALHRLALVCWHSCLLMRPACTANINGEFTTLIVSAHCAAVR